MFSGYEGLMPYYVDQDGSLMNGNENEDYDIPAHYMPPDIPIDPWFRSSVSSSDFLLLAEGSELEGPLPLIIIPKNGSGKFNVDEFVVRIMAVDHQLMSGCSFSISEDVQVFLSQMENGIYAYVHYFTLYDSLARGFVRPFCLAYVTPDYSKIMHMSHELMIEFARVSECFKSGNHLVFFQDMAHILSDLQFTRERYLECQSSAQDVENHIPEISSNHVETSEEKALQRIHLHELDSSIAEVKNILQTLNEKLEKTDQSADHRFCDNKVVEPRETPLDSDNFRITHVLNSSQKFEPNNHLSEKCTEATCQMMTDMSESYKPKLKTNLKPTIQKSLRSINDLCQKRAKQGLDYLRNVYKYFRRDTATLLMEKEDSSVLDPSCSLLTIGRIVYLNFLKGFDTLADRGCPITSPKSCSLVCSPTGTLGHKWQSSDSLASFYSCETPESFASCSDPSPSSQHPLPAVPPLPPLQMEKKLSPDEPDDEMKKVQQHNSTSICQMFFQATSQVTSRPQTLSFDQKSYQIPTQVSVISVSDHVYNLKETSYGIGSRILQFVREYSFAAHLIYSLLCGRPVLIVGSMSFEKEIRDLVTALWIFLPGHASDSQFVLPWATVPLKLSDLKNLKLCGLGKPEKKTYEWMIPKNVKSYTTVFYFDRKSLWAPRYEGGVINEIIQMNQAFECDGSYISFIHSKLFQLTLKSFSYFHGFCMRKSPGFLDGLEHVSRQESWLDMSHAFAKNLDLTENDRRIVEYLSEVVILQQAKEIEDCQMTECHSTIRLDHQISHLFLS